MWCSHRSGLCFCVEATVEEERRSEAVPAWRRQIVGLSPGGRRRRLIVAERGPLEHRREKKKQKKKNVFLTFSDKLTLLKCTEEIYWPVCLPFSLPWLLFSCSTPSWISLRLSRSCLAKICPLFIIMMDLLSMRPWKSFRRRLFSCSFTLLSTATITSFSSRMESVRSSKSSSVSVF